MEERAETPPRAAGEPIREDHPAQIAVLIERLQRAQRRLARRSTESILASLDTVVREWLRPGSPWQRCAEELLPAATGFSADMVRRALPSQIAPLRAPCLRSLLEDEIGERAFRAERSDTIPNLIVHVLPGNLPGLAAIPVTFGLSLRSATLVKAASGDRVFPALWARSIREIDPELGSCVSACYWPGGNRACEEIAFAAADLVVASGDNESITAMRARCRGRFIGHGHRVSFAVVAREVLADARLAEDAADALALDVALWDQRGCLSPQVCFLEATFDEARRFASRLTGAFDRQAKLLPPRQLSVEEQVAVRRFRNEAEWKKIAGRDHALFASGEALEWSLVVEADPIFRPTPLCRSLRILSLRDIREIGRSLLAARPFLQAAGLACPNARREEIWSILREAGVPHLATLGEMQRPPLSWRQDGRPRIADWVPSE